MDICRRKFGACILAGLASRAWALPPRPRLLVLVVLEQFRPDYLDVIWSQVGEGGLRRLIQGGAYFPDCRNAASSFPASSLATLATASWPAQHGVVADRWYDRKERGPVHASAETLLATTLLAQVAAAPGTRSFVVSLSEQSGSLFAGTPSARRFWRDEEGHFATHDDPPEWLDEYNRLKRIADFHGAEWLALGAKPGAPALRTLQYDPARPRDFLSLYEASPFGQGAEFEFFEELLTRERIGQGDTFDLACLLTGSTARLGYETGANSPLMHQMALHLDRQLNVLLDQLDRAPGRGMYDVVLVGAHGAPPEPPSFARPRMAVSGEGLAQSIQRTLAQAKSGRVEKYLYPFLYLESPGGGRVPEAVAVAAARAALEQDEVAAYYTAGGECSIHDDWERRFRNSFHPTRSGDVMLSYPPEYIEETGASRGVSYGSLYTYDTKVPLCCFGPQFRPGVFETPVELVDVAPTLARAVGVPPPSSSVGRVLGEAFLGAEDPIR